MDKENKGETKQQRFDRLYISSGEICERLGVTRATVGYAKKTGMLPAPITLGGKTESCLWEREEVEEYLLAWQTMLTARRNRHAKQDI